MKQVTKKGLMTVVATSGVLAATGGYAYADTGAQGAAVHSPGVVSGNSVQVPVHVPVNACGDTVDVIGGLNPAFGNHCTNASHHADSRYGGGAGARGAADRSPGVGSGNNAQVPVDVPVNACGDTVGIVGLLNPAFGDGCANVSHTGHTANCHCQRPKKKHHCQTPKRKVTCPPKQRRHEGVPEATNASAPAYGHSVIHQRHDETAELANTGTDDLGLAIAASAGALIGGTLLYRRGRRSGARA